MHRADGSKGILETVNLCSAKSILKLRIYPTPYFRTDSVVLLLSDITGINQGSIGFPMEPFCNSGTHSVECFEQITIHVFYWALRPIRQAVSIRQLRSLLLVQLRRDSSRVARSPTPRIGFLRAILTPELFSRLAMRYRRREVQNSSSSGAAGYDPGLEFGTRCCS